MSGVTSARMVGPIQLPWGALATLAPRPSSTRRAPWSTPLWMSFSMRARDFFETTGPRSAPGSMPGPILSALALAASSSTHSEVSPTKTAVERAMQRWPAAPNAAPASWFSTDSLLASGMIVAWFLAAMLHWTRLLLPPALRLMCSPAWFEPTKDTPLMSGWSQTKFTESCVPWMMFRTPSGTPASLARRARIMGAPGSTSEGFITNVLPVARAMGNIQSGIMAGKLKGVTPAKTPTGCL
mmetsp:Transcript_18716/g.72212  ORF Transcript_18716/g.72212 Transcript_18716/m.72212 type:complete len:240 (+) Transcript_18716:425-1144(+)